MNIAKVRALVRAQHLDYRPARVFVVYRETGGQHEQIDVTTFEDLSAGRGRQCIAGLAEPAKWRWRLIAPMQHRTDKQIVGSSGENFDSKSNAVRAAKTEASYYAPNRVAVVVLA